MSNWVPISPRSGGLVHITSLTDSHRTQCNRVISGWRIATGVITCERCREAVHLPVKRRKA